MAVVLVSADFEMHTVPLLQLFCEFLLNYRKHDVEFRSTEGIMPMASKTSVISGPTSAAGVIPAGAQPLLTAATTQLLTAAATAGLVRMIVAAATANSS